MLEITQLIKNCNSSEDLFISSYLVVTCSVNAFWIKIKSIVKTVSNYKFLLFNLRKVNIYFLK